MQPQAARAPKRKRGRPRGSYKKRGSSSGGGAGGGAKRFKAKHIKKPPPAGYARPGTFLFKLRNTASC